MLVPFIGYFVLAMFRLSIGIIIPEVMSEFKITETFGGALLSSFLCAIAIMVIYGGRISDRFGKKITISIGSTIASFGIILGSYSNGYWILVISFFIAGTGAGIFIAGLYGFVGETIPSMRGTLLGFTISSFAIGGFIGPFVSAIFILKFGWRSPFQFIGILILLLSIFSWLNVKGEFRKSLFNKEPKTRALIFLKDTRIIYLCLAFGFANFAFAAFAAWAPSYLISIGNLNLSEAGFSFGLFSLIGAIGATFFGIISDKFGRKSSLMASGIFASILSLLYFSGHVSSIILIIFTGAIGFASYPPANLIISATQDLVDNHSIGSATGFTFSIGMIGGAFAPTISGFLISNYGFNFALILSVAIFYFIYTIIVSKAI